MATCSKCGVEYPPPGSDAPRHKHPCPLQTDKERIKELREALILARYEINRVLDVPGGP